MTDADTTSDSAATTGTRPTLGGLPTVTAAEAKAAHAALGDHDLTEDAVVDQSADSVADLILKELLQAFDAPDVGDAVVTVMCGTGHTGRVGLAVAERMVEAGATVNVVLAGQPKQYEGTAATRIEALDKTAKKVYKGYNERAFDKADLIVDGLVGAGLEGGRLKAALSLLVKGANFSIKPILALDLPTGLDPDTGVPGKMTVKARATAALGLPKAGLVGRGARDVVGDVYVVDIGVPEAVWKAVGVDGVAPLRRSWRKLGG